MRMFAKPPPSTMTQEYQEATNEFLRVSAAAGPSARRRQPCPLLLLFSSWPSLLSSTVSANPTLSTEPRGGALHGSLVRRLLGQGPRSVGPGEGIDAVRFLLSIEAACWTRNRCSCDLAMGGGDGGGALGLIMGGDIGWCKYCTTLTMRHRFLGAPGWQQLKLGSGRLFVVMPTHSLWPMAASKIRATLEPVICVQRPDLTRIRLRKAWASCPRSPD
jgi:hypothetical protein